MLDSWCAFVILPLIAPDGIFTNVNPLDCLRHSNAQLFIWLKFITRSGCFFGLSALPYLIRSLRTSPPFYSFPGRLELHLDLQEHDKERFSDFQFSAAVFWTMLRGDRRIDYILNLPSDAAREGNTLILNSPEDLPTHAHVFGMTVPLPSEIIDGDHVWQMRFYKHNALDVFAVNDIPVAVLATDAERVVPQPFPAGAGVLYAAAWCAYKTLEGLENLTSIRQLLVQSLAPMPLEHMEELRSLPNLQHLEFIGSLVGEIPPGFLPNSLKSLTIALPRSVKNLECLSHLTDLESLTISQCSFLKDLSKLANFPKLRNLDIRNAHNLTDISIFDNFSDLRKLDLSGAVALENLHPLSRLDGLESLTLMNCSSVQSLSALADLKNLRFLNLTGCSEIQSFLPISTMSETRIIMPNGEFVN